MKPKENFLSADALLVILVVVVPVAELGGARVKGLLYVVLDVSHEAWGQL